MASKSLLFASVTTIDVPGNIHGPVVAVPLPPLVTHSVPGVSPKIPMRPDVGSLLIHMFTLVFGLASMTVQCTCTTLGVLAEPQSLSAAGVMVMLASPEWQPGSARQRAAMGSSLRTGVSPMG